MKVQAQPHGTATVLAPHGALVADELADLARLLGSARRGPVRHVVLDMAEVPYVDSAGLELLLEHCGVQRAAHQRTKVAGLTETCREALELTDVLARLETFDSVENALRSCQR